MKVLEIALDGYLCDSTIGVATNGYLCITEPIPPTIEHISSGGMKAKHSITKLSRQQWKRRDKYKDFDDRITKDIVNGLITIKCNINDKEYYKSKQLKNITLNIDDINIVDTDKNEITIELN